MRTRTARCAALCAALCLLAGCGAAPANRTDTLTVFAAASLTETLTALGADYKKAHPETDILFNFDSSGTLAAQIEAGAACDLFISASPRQMDALGVVRAETRVDLLENRIVLAVPDGDPADIGSFDALADRLQAGGLLLAIGNSDVPVGQYTQQLFAHYGLDEAALAAAGCLTYDSNVKEITAQIREGAVDCGVVYRTDAFSAGLTVTDTASEAVCGPIVYPAAVLDTAENGAAAQEFLNYLTEDAADAVFEAVGFIPIG